MYSTKFLGGLCFCLRWGGGGKFGDVNSLLQLFIYVRSKLEDISILVLLCLNTYTTKSCECRAGRVFSGPARVNPFGPTKISNFTIVCAWPYGSCHNIGLFQTCWDLRMKKSPSKISTKYTTNTTRPEEKRTKLFSVRQRFNGLWICRSEKSIFTTDALTCGISKEHSSANEIAPW